MIEISTIVASLIISCSVVLSVYIRSSHALTEATAVRTHELAEATAVRRHAMEQIEASAARLMIETEHKTLVAAGASLEVEEARQAQLHFAHMAEQCKLAQSALVRIGLIKDLDDPDIRYLLQAATRRINVGLPAPTRSETNEGK
jgi:hypothetical protein